MSRVVSLCLPTWPTDRLRRRMGAAAPDAATPLVLVGQAGRRREVVAADVAASQAGLRIGMPATQAQALVAGLVIHHADPAADAEALERLAVWALRYSPLVAADAPDGIVIDATGATHLHGGEDAMLADMISRLQAAGIAARAAIADTRGAAHALARFAARPRLVVPEGEGADRIGPLPIAALRLAPDTVDDLRKLGFERISDLLATPRAPLTLRFGPELGRRIDQATGRTGEPIDPVRPADIVEAQQIFAEPIAAPETIARYVAKLTAKLCQELELRGLGARRLDLLFGLVDNRVQAVRVGTAQPVRDVKRLTRLLCDKIEKVDPGLRHRDHAAGGDRRRAVRDQADDLVAGRRAGGGRFRADRHPLQPRRREPALPVRSGGERRSGAVGAPGRRGGSGHRRGVARPLAAPSPAAGPA